MVPPLSLQSLMRASPPTCPLCSTASQAPGHDRGARGPIQPEPLPARRAPARPRPGSSLRDSLGRLAGLAPSVSPGSREQSPCRRCAPWNRKGVDFEGLVAVAGVSWSERSERLSPSPSSDACSWRSGTPSPPLSEPGSCYWAQGTTDEGIVIDHFEEMPKKKKVSLASHCHCWSRAATRGKDPTMFQRDRTK